MPLRLDHDITALKGADYNPRAISDEDFAALVESVRELGVVKPIIARKETIVAGHQRTRALRALGIVRAPVYLLEADATAYDEVRFNQLHNGTDLDGEARAPETRSEDLGWRHFAPGSIVADGRQRYAPIRYSIASLIATYGPWGACVATQSGEIIHCAQYAIACSQVGQPVLAYIVPDADRDRYKSRLSRGYGVYSYDHIERRTYVQSYAQPFRLRGNQQYQLKSDLYEKEVIPRLRRDPSLRVIDFGSGQGDYAKRLRREGFNVLDLEFFRRGKGKGGNAIAVGRVHRMIDRLLREVSAGRRFDLVVCDYVINSVDSVEAERAVMVMLNALCRPAGDVFFSGRREPTEHLGTKHAPRELREVVYFVDDKGFTANYRHGAWFFQKFHNAAQVRELCRLGGLRFVSQNREKATNVNWQAHATKRDEPDREALRAAIEFEFNLPVSDNRRYNRHHDALRAWGIDP